MSSNCFPNLFLVGPTKTGTTSLYAYLNQHPAIFFSHAKEVHFFDRADRYSKGLDFYLDAYFKKSDAYPVRADATPSYFAPMTRVPGRIRESCPDIRPTFVMTLRDPVKRAWSHFLHTTRIGAEKEPFKVALALESARLKSDPEAWLGYVQEGLYARYLKIWLEHFDLDQFMFVKADDLDIQPKAVLDQICMRFQISPQKSIDTSPRHNAASRARNTRLMAVLVGASRVKEMLKPLLFSPLRRALKRYAIKLNTVPFDVYPTLDEEIEHQLRSTFREDLLEFESITGISTASWRSGISEDNMSSSVSRV